MGFNNPGRTNGKAPADSVAAAAGYDSGTTDTDGAPFDFNSAFADSVGACACAVVATGDMFQLTTDKGRYAVHIVIRSNEGDFDRWFNNAEKAIFRLDKLYDSAVAKRNRKYPPALPGA